MSEWDAYVVRYYALSQDEQRREWEKLTPDQRVQFEAARDAAAKRVASPRASSRHWWIRGCALVAGFFVLCILGLAFVGSMVDVPDTTQEKANEKPRQANASARLKEIEALREDPERTQQALQKAEELLAQFPESSEATQIQEILPELEAAVAEQERMAEEFRQQREEEERRRALANRWTYSQGADEMTGRSSFRAMIRSENTVEFSFPYHGPQRGSLVFRSHPSYGRDVLFKIEKGQILCNTYDRCNVRVRFDDGEAQNWQGTPPADHSTTTVFLPMYDQFLRRMRNAEVVRIQPEIYQHGSPIFEFHVGGYNHSLYTGK